MASDGRGAAAEAAASASSSGEHQTGVSCCQAPRLPLAVFAGTHSAFVTNCALICVWGLRSTVAARGQEENDFRPVLHLPALV